MAEVKAYLCINVPYRARRYELSRFNNSTTEVPIRDLCANRCIAYNA